MSRYSNTLVLWFHESEAVVCFTGSGMDTTLFFLFKRKDRPDNEAVCSEMLNGWGRVAEWMLILDGRLQHFGKNTIIDFSCVH